MLLPCTTRSLVALAAIATIEGCASAHPARSVSAGYDAHDELPPARRDYDRLTALEIATGPGFPTAYEAVQHFRHQFLKPTMTSRGSFDRRFPDVFINNSPSGGVEALRSIPTHRVTEIRFIRRDDAYRRYGRAYSAGVILVMTKR
jgi:hypothetical protein